MRHLFIVVFTVNEKLTVTGEILVAHLDTYTSRQFGVRPLHPASRRCSIPDRPATVVVALAVMSDQAGVRRRREHGIASRRHLCAEYAVDQRKPVLSMFA